MIIISNSIVKTGSTHLINVQQEILGLQNAKNGQSKLLEKYEGRFIHYFSPKVLLNIRYIDKHYGSIIVKCHKPKNLLLDYYFKFSNTKMTITYRDPRDVILSMIDHGNRTRNTGNTSGPFAHCYDVIDLIPRVQKMFKSLEFWKSKEYVFPIKYEEFMRDKISVLGEMSEFLQWSVQEEMLNKIIAHHDNQKFQTRNYNVGSTQRWRLEMTDKEKDACLEAFRPYLMRLGYSLYS